MKPNFPEPLSEVAKMQKKSNSFLKKELRKLDNVKYIEGISFEKLIEITEEKEDYTLN